MALKRYILQQDFKAPYMRVTGNPRKPGKLCGFSYKKGDVITGELKHANDQPAMVLVVRNGIQLPFPVGMVKEVSEKEVGATTDSAPVSSSADGESEKTITSKIMSNNPKIQYLDAAIIGGLLGFLAIWGAEKKGLIISSIPGDKKNKIYGVIAGSLVALYVVYRIKNNKKFSKKE